MSEIKPKILIIEDEFSSQVYYTAVLEEDYDLSIAPNVVAAKKLLLEKRFNLAIVDLALPGDEDGLSLIRYLRKEHPEINASIAITAHAYPENREDALTAGAAEFLVKPILTEALLKVVKLYLDLPNTVKNDT
jgi:DNA-binding response OmpR family regulator